MTDPSEALSRVAIFAGLDASLRREVLDRCPARTIAAGRMIVSAGERADRFFVVLSGRVRVFHLSAQGQQQILHLFGPGDIFGEAAMFAGGDFPANADTTEDSLLLEVRRSVLLDLIRRRPDAALRMLAGMSAKLREFAGLIESLSLKDVPARVAAALLSESHRAGAMEFRLKEPKRQLALRLGTTPETLSRTLSRMQSDRMIEVRGSRIRILDAGALQKRARS